MTKIGDKVRFTDERKQYGVDCSCPKWAEDTDGIITKINTINGNIRVLFTSKSGERFEQEWFKSSFGVK
jgi:hypothetical protein